MNSPLVRPLEASITRDLRGRLSYGEYLCLAQLLSAQRPISAPPHHDELLFIVQHQTTELWFKLIIHELRAVLAQLACDQVGPALKGLARVKHIQRQLFEQWAVLETLTPSEYTAFRSVLGSASGFQSQQYRLVEFLLGNKNVDNLAVFAHQPEIHAELQAALEAPSLYETVLALLARRGHAIPADIINRDHRQPWVEDARLIEPLRVIYTDPEQDWDAYHLCEQLVDIEESFQLWRFRHLKTVERIIGYKPGTGGSSGVHFLRQALDLRFFPELLAVRTALG